MTIQHSGMVKAAKNALICLFSIHLLLNSAAVYADDSNAAAKTVLAPSGTLLVGVYKGSPTSIIEGSTPQENKGVGYDLGKALAGQLGVPSRAVIFPNNAALLAAIKKGEVDFSVTNATPARKKNMDFSPSFMEVEKSFLVPPDSKYTAIDDLAASSALVGVSKGSSTAKTLTELFPKLHIREIDTLAHAIDMLKREEIAAFATNDAILFQMSDAIPGSKVLPGHWDMEYFAAGIPKGRDAGLPVLKKFIIAAEGDGRIAGIIKRAGLRGASSKIGK